MFTKPYHISVGGTSYRVEQDFWNESEENREFIRRRCIYINGDTAWPRDFPLDIAVMSKDQPSGCIHYEDHKDFAEQVEALIRKEAAQAALGEAAGFLDLIERLERIKPGIENNNSSAEIAMVEILPEVIEALHHLIASETRPAGSQAWRSLDSAPKDGTSILLKSGLVDRLYIGFNVGDGWIERGSRHVDRPPTHWMPLPSMPDQEVSR